MSIEFEGMSLIDKISLSFSNFLLNNLQAEYGKLKYRKNKNNLEWIISQWNCWKNNQNILPIKKLEDYIKDKPIPIPSIK